MSICVMDVLYAPLMAELSLTSSAQMFNLLRKSIKKCGKTRKMLVDALEQGSVDAVLIFGEQDLHAVQAEGRCCDCACVGPPVTIVEAGLPIAPSSSLFATSFIMMSRFFLKNSVCFVASILPAPDRKA